MSPIQFDSVQQLQLNGVAKQFNEVNNDAKMNSTESQKVNKAQSKIQQLIQRMT